MARRQTGRKLNAFDVLLLSICIHCAILYGLSLHLDEPGQRLMSKDDVEPVKAVPVAVIPPQQFKNLTKREKSQPRAVPVIPVVPDRPKPVVAKPDGQVVDILPPKDTRPPEDAQLLAAHNSRVEKETVAEKNAPPTPKMRQSDRRVLSGGDDINGSRQGRNMAARSPVSDPAQRADTPTPGVQKKRKNTTQRRKKTRQKNRRMARKRAPKGTALPSGDGRFAPEKTSNQESATGTQAAGPSGAQTGPEHWQALLPSLGDIDQKQGDGSIDHLPNVEKGDGTFLNTREYRHAWFFNRVKRSVRQRWTAAQRHREQDPRGKIYGVRDRLTVVDVTLSSEGALKHIEVLEDSGVSILDEAAIQAFEQAEPFPNPPAELRDADGNIRFKFGFFLEIRGRSFRVFRPY